MPCYDRECRETGCLSSIHGVRDRGIASVEIDGVWAQYARQRGAALGKTVCGERMPGVWSPAHRHCGHSLPTGERVASRERVPTGEKGAGAPPGR